MYLAVFVPELCLQAAMREAGQSHESERGFAVTEKQGALHRVMARDERAAQLGVAIGMTANEAEAAGVTIVERWAAWERAACAEIVRVLSDCSPTVESAGNGAAVADIRGTEALLGDAMRLARRVRQVLRRRGLRANIAAAAQPETALALARGREAVTVAHAGEEAALLAPLAIDVLPSGEEIRAMLANWGIRTCGQLAALPSLALSERCGQTGLRLQRIAKGEWQRALIAGEEELSFREATELDDEIESLETLSFVVHRMLLSVMGRLAAHGSATEQVRLRLWLVLRPDRQLGEPAPETVEVKERALKVPVPTQDATAVMTLLRLDLEARPPAAPIKRVELECIRSRMRHAQGGLFAPATPDAEKMEVVLARLRALAGQQDAVGSPRVCDTHLPDSFMVVAFTPVRGGYATQEKHGEPALALRIRRESNALRVVCEDARPVRLYMDGTSMRVAQVSGPWCLSGRDAATGQAWSREYWDVVIVRAGVSRIYSVFCDVIGGQWYLHGEYD